MISVVNGRLADIPKPGPSLPDVLKHPDYSTFMAKLSALPGPPITIRNEFDSTKPSPPLDFEFMEDLKLGEGVPEWDSSASFGCSCGLGGCENNPECECLEKLDMDESHSPFAELSYTKSQRLCPGHCNTKIIYECNPVCDCGPNCGNKVVGRGRQVPLEIFMTPENKGWGLRCPEALHKGTFIGKYLGEVVTHEEATKRAIDGDTRGSSYLFDLDFFTEGHEEDGDEGREVENYSIDGRLCGSYTRFINHSCDPNTDVYVVVSYRRDSIVYDLAMFTNRDLQPWEEITFSYTEGPAPVGPEGKTKTWPCHCGASNCRGELW
ncbi:SET domain-containing protein [Ascodesmis nigricans]|uniref:SET domain-containing protein n=1 Tax=Ascodesmis nigricans TaxID=341454 RepID=A0A4S2MT76_9PEZI|nr:SET domain-containing protein [Ascodesmis nigricans]